MRIKFWGVRGSIPTPGESTLRYGGNTPCVEIECGNTLVIIDAGSGIRELGNALLQRRELNEYHLLITHTHWDHIQGLPFFVPIYMPGKKVHIYGCHGASSTLEEVLTDQMELPFFPKTLNDVRTQIQFHEVDEGEFSLNDIAIKTMFTNHPGVCLAYRLEWQGATLVYLCDNEPYDRLAGPLEEARIDKRLIAFSRHAHLLIIDCAYTLEEYQQRRGWGHGCVDDVVKIGKAAQVKRMALFHHDPSHNDLKIDAMIAHARKLIADDNQSLDCFAAQEGMGIEI